MHRLYYKGANLVQVNCAPIYHNGQLQQSDVCLDRSILALLPNTTIRFSNLALQVTDFNNRSRITDRPTATQLETDAFVPVDPKVGIPVFEFGSLSHSCIMMDIATQLDSLPPTSVRRCHWCDTSFDAPNQVWIRSVLLST